MNETKSQNETEPTLSDNSAQQTQTQNQTQVQDLVKDEKGQSQDPSNLILGKFKTVEDLSKAYTELQKRQGESSKELGDLRKTANSMNDLSDTLQQVMEMKADLGKYLEEYREKYNTPEYFQDNAFKEIYKEAFKVLGKNLDTDRFINLLEGYVGSRINSYEKSKSAKSETEAILNSMTYDKSTKTGLTPPKKRFDEMTDSEIDEMLDRVL